MWALISFADLILLQRRTAREAYVYVTQYVS